MSRKHRGRRRHKQTTKAKVPPHIRRWINETSLRVGGGTSEVNGDHARGRKPTDLG